LVILQILNCEKIAQLFADRGAENVMFFEYKANGESKKKIEELLKLK